MSLYRVLFVDCNIEARDEIIGKIDWADCGFELAAAAEDGQHALELAKRIKPDLVITEVELPIIDGLELCRILSGQMPLVKLIILSSVNDFQTVQQAIKIGIKEYFLKPADEIEIMNALKNLKSFMDREISKKRNLYMLQDHYIQTLDIAKEEFLLSVIEGRDQSENLLEQAVQYNLNMVSKYWVAAVVRINEEKPGPTPQSVEMSLTSVKNLLNKDLMKFSRINSFIYGCQVIVIAMLDAEYMVYDFVGKISHICKISYYFLKFGLSAGVGLPYDKLENLSRSYTEALEALDYRAFRDANQAIYIGEIDYDAVGQLEFSEQDEYDLLGVVKLESPEKIKNAINQLFSRFNGPMLPLNCYRTFLIEMLAVLINLVRNYKLDINKVFQDGFNECFASNGFDSLQSLHSWVCEACFNINTFIKRERMSTTKLTVERAKQFIDEHYGDSEISVEMLCEHLHISPSYFSTIFKRESGMTFVDYLTEVRLEQAVKLLNSTEKKFSSICAMVGYTDPNYFSYVFKKHFGISPSKYKNN